MLSDLRAAVAGRANYLAALGLLVYSEVIGRTILQLRGEKKPPKDKAFYCFYQEYMGQERAPAEKIYEHYRHGAAHTYGFLAADKSIVRMRPDPEWVPVSEIKGIVTTEGGKVKEFAVNAYFRDFQRGLARAAEEYPREFKEVKDLRR